MLGRTRRVLDNVDLTNLARAVAEADEMLVDSSFTAPAVFEAAGFADVALAFNAVHRFTKGSVGTTANRKASTANFGRDPKGGDPAQGRPHAQIGGATPEQIGIVEARFDKGVERTSSGACGRSSQGFSQHRLRRRPRTCGRAGRSPTTGT